MIKVFAALPMVALVYVLIVQPVANKLLPGAIDHQVIWPLLAALTIILFARFRRDTRISELLTAPYFLMLMLLGFLGLSVIWAFNSEIAFKRWLLAVFVVATTLVPLTLKRYPFDVVGAAAWSFLCAMLVNGLLILTTPPFIDGAGNVFGHYGVYFHKQYLGTSASAALILGIYLGLHKGRRLIAVAACGLAAWVIIASNSKSAFGFLFLALGLSVCVMAASRLFGCRLVYPVLAVPISYAVLSLSINKFLDRIAYAAYGDTTFTGRTFIWEFIESNASQRPWLGWGFRSFWFVPNSPSQYAPSFIKDMTSSHSGYLELRIDSGYVGIAIFVALLVATVVRLERVREVDPRRCFVMLSLLTYIALQNFLESIWFTAFDPLWLMFLIFLGEMVRYPVPANYRWSVRSNARHKITRTRWSMPHLRG